MLQSLIVPICAYVVLHDSSWANEAAEANEVLNSISTHDTYLHSWGSIFVQDVILPLRKNRLKPKQHLRLLR